MANKKLTVVPAPLQVDQHLSENWTKFEHDFRAYLINTTIEQNGTNHSSDNDDLAVLLNVIGEDGLKIFNKLNLSESQLNNIETVLKEYETYCNNISNNLIISAERDIATERSIFHQRLQGENESFNSFLEAINKLAETCAFGNHLDAMLLDRIVLGVWDVDTRRKLEELQSLTLENVISFCRSSELLKKQSIDQINIACQKNNRSTECVLQNSAVNISSGDKVRKINDIHIVTKSSSLLGI